MGNVNSCCSTGWGCHPRGRGGVPLRPQCRTVMPCDPGPPAGHHLRRIQVCTVTGSHTTRSPHVPTSHPWAPLQPCTPWGNGWWSHGLPAARRRFHAVGKALNPPRPATQPQSRPGMSGQESIPGRPPLTAPQPPLPAFVPTGQETAGPLKQGSFLGSPPLPCLARHGPMRL